MTSTCRRQQRSLSPVPACVVDGNGVFLEEEHGVKAEILKAETLNAE
jgi:hypothetical protein